MNGTQLLHINYRHGNFDVASPVLYGNAGVGSQGTNYTFDFTTGRFMVPVNLNHTHISTGNAQQLHFACLRLQSGLIPIAAGDLANSPVGRLIECRLGAELQFSTRDTENRDRGDGTSGVTIWSGFAEHVLLNGQNYWRLNFTALQDAIWNNTTRCLQGRLPDFFMVSFNYVQGPPNAPITTPPATYARPFEPVNFTYTSGTLQAPLISMEFLASGVLTA